MNKLIAVIAVVVPLIAVSSPSLATKGIDAARACDKNPKCTLLLDDAGGATIIIGDTVIDCPGPQQDCSVVRTAPGKNKGRGLAIPAGTILATAR